MRPGAPDEPGEAEPDVGRGVTVHAQKLVHNGSSVAPAARGASGGERGGPDSQRKYRYLGTPLSHLRVGAARTTTDQKTYIGASRRTIVPKPLDFLSSSDSNDRQAAVIIILSHVFVKK